MTTKEVLRLAVTRLRVPAAMLTKLEQVAFGPDAMQAMDLARDAQVLADQIEAFISRADGTLR